MNEALLHKTNTGISSEFFVAGELARRSFNVTLTFGNTKSIDLLIEKNGNLIPVQVKGIQRTSSICWNVNLAKLDNSSLIFVLVNLHADSLQQPEYFVLTNQEVKEHFKPTKNGRDYLDYNLALKLDFKDKWEKIFGDGSDVRNDDPLIEKKNTLTSMQWNGYCPESELQGKQVRMLINSDDFFESEATGLQMAIVPGVQAVIMNFRGKGKFCKDPIYGDEIEGGEFLSPQTTDRPPFNIGELFQESEEVEKYINEIS